MSPGEWETLGRTVAVPVAMPLSVEVRQGAEGRWWARTRDLGTVLEVSASSRLGAVARLETLAEGVFRKLVDERCVASA